MRSDEQFVILRRDRESGVESYFSDFINAEKYCDSAFGFEKWDDGRIGLTTYMFPNFTEAKDFLNVLTKRDGFTYEILLVKTSAGRWLEPDTYIPLKTFYTTDDL